MSEGEALVKASIQSLQVVRDLVRGVPAAATFLVRLFESARRAPQEFCGTHYRVRVVTEESVFEALEHDWMNLLQRSTVRSPFSSWIWLYAWWREIGRLAGDAPRIVAIYDETGILVGVAAFYVAVDRFGCRILRNMGDIAVGSEYLDVIRDPAHDREVIGIVLSYLATVDGVDGSLLSDLAETSPLVSAVRTASAGILAAEEAVCQRLPYVDLSGSFQGFLQRASGNMRSNLKRKQKKLLERYPAAHLACVTQEDELAEALDQLFRLHELRWESRGQSGNFGRPGVKAFHRVVCPKLLAANMLRLYALKVDERTVAATFYCLRFKNCEFYLQAGFDPAYEAVSAGFCLMRMIVERCADEGLSEFDLLRGTEAYKTHWADGDHVTKTVRFARRTPKGIAWASGQKLQSELTRILRERLPRERLGELATLRQRLHL